MALFPAYGARDNLDRNVDEQARWDTSSQLPLESNDIVEAQLLASDTEEEREKEKRKNVHVHTQSMTNNDDFYVDCKMDRGNLRVSTLYYPGRPQKSANEHAVDLSDYRRPCGRPRPEVLQVRCRRPIRAAAKADAWLYHIRVHRAAAGESRWAPGAGDRASRRRYFRRRASDPSHGTAAAERAAAYRRLLDDAPHDVGLWERYIDFQECYGTEQETVAAAELAAARGGLSRRLRVRLYATLRRALPAQPYAERLRKSLATEQDVGIRLELWVELMRALGAAAEGGARAVAVLAAAALRDTRALPRAYPRLLYEYGVFLRAGGLWEQLVLLVELVAAMNFPRAAFPPPLSAGERRCREQRLRLIEDKAIDSGLPLSAVWVRVERARAAAHWRPAHPAGSGAGCAAGDAADPGDEDDGDPQRSPLPHDVAELLLPVVDPHQLFRLSVRLLMLAKVPLLGGAGWSPRGEPGRGGECGEELLPLLGEARLLPRAHAAHAAPALAQRLLAHMLDPPHYFSDEYGYLTWTNALWEACCGWAAGPRRTALLCWRLRWLRALLLVAGAAGPDGVAERRRLRGEARSLLRRLAGAAPLPFAEWARLDHAAAAAEAADVADIADAATASADPDSALRAARQALRAALTDKDTPHHHLLYIARVVGEVGGAEAGAAALASAVLRRAGAPDQRPSRALLQQALLRCEEQCEALEREFEREAALGEAGAGAAGEEGEEEEEDELCALLPARAEWGAARALLAPPPRRAALLERLLAAPQAGSSAAARYWQQSAAALVLAARGRSAAARALAAHCPHSHYLAAAGAGAPLWASAGLRGEPPAPAPPAAGPAALAALLPPLLRALAADWAPRESEVLVRAARRTLCGPPGAACGPLGAALRLEAEGRAPRPRLPHALYAALVAAPHHKWLHVRGAVWCGGEAAALADMLLDKLLRLHALPHELQPLPPQPQLQPQQPQPQQQECRTIREMEHSSPEGVQDLEHLQSVTEMS